MIDVGPNVLLNRMELVQDEDALFLNIPRVTEAQYARISDFLSPYNISDGVIIFRDETPAEGRPFTSIDCTTIGLAAEAEADKMEQVAIEIEKREQAESGETKMSEPRVVIPSFDPKTFGMKVWNIIREQGAQIDFDNSVVPAEESYYGKQP